MTRPASEILEDLLAVALRIERILTREADNATVEFYRKQLAKRQPEPLSTPSGMPDPPLPKVQTTWGTSLPGHLNPLNINDYSAPEQVSKEPYAYPRTFMHGGWIHATGFSMVGP